MKLFSGTGNPKLSEKVAKLLDIPLAKAEVVRFENSEVRVHIEEDVADQTAVVIQPSSNPTDTNLMELFFFCDALKRSGASKVIAVIPYFGYARQNIQHRPGEDVSANVVIKFLEQVGFDNVLAFDLHEEATEGIFSIPFKGLTALPLLAKHIKDQLKLPEDQVVVASPDQGGVERARKFADAFFTQASSVAVIEKSRDLNTPHKSEAIAIHGDVEGRTVVLVDDIVTSGGTLIHAADLCLSKGATKVYAAVVHHDFASFAPAQLQNSKLEKFFTSDTILLQDGQKFDKLEEISVAPIIATELKSLT